MNWTDEKVDLLKSLYADGLSGGQIAMALRCTRNTVIGKIHRMGLPGRVSTSRLSSRPHSRSPRIPKPPVQMLVLAAPLIEPEALLLDEGRHVTLLEVSGAMCRWPIGDTREPDFHFCGHVQVKGKPYCEAHNSKAHQPMTGPRHATREAAGTVWQ